ncbi:MAG: hypothetical protein CMG71_06315 [Candidatus Marinimicrobia bacterium]|nr:hypothetical protein [Candidatus Neomarinimicrobiota bacterium]
MPSTKLLSLACLLIWSCEKLPVIDFANPLDVRQSQNDGILLPALVFYPDSVVMKTGETARVTLFAMEVQGLSAARVQIDYEHQKLNLVSNAAGDILQSLTNPFFQVEDDTANGVIDIFTVSYGVDSLKTVTGTGSLAVLEFQATAPGKIILEYTDACEFVDHDDNPITIESRLRGVLDVSDN